MSSFSLFFSTRIWFVSAIHHLAEKYLLEKSKLQFSFLLHVVNEMLFIWEKTGEHVELGIFAPVPGGPLDQATSPGLYDPYTALDICTIIQSTAVCVSAHCDAVLYLFDCWNAGEMLRFCAVHYAQENGLIVFV